MSTASVFGDRVRQAREQKRHPGGKRWEQKDLAEALGVAPNTVSGWETRGAVPRDPVVIARIAEVLGVSVDWLIGREGNGGGPPPLPLPRQLEAMALRFRAEALEMGADDEDMGFIDGVLKSPGTSIMVAGGYEAPKTPEAQRIEMESVVAMLRAWLEGRMEMRDEEKRRR